MKLVRGIALGLAAIFAVFAAVAFLARFADGPLGPLPGGTLRSGPLHESSPGGWAFAAGVEEVELQLVAPPRSRTTWILVLDDHAYVPCGFPHIRVWKQWPHQALADGRAIVRIDGRRHRVGLTRTDDAALQRRLIEVLGEKYPTARDISGEVWFFRLDPRSSG